jgi:hypothetical protein
MIIDVQLNIQRSVSSILNIEGALFEIGMNIQRELPINLVR